MKQNKKKAREREREKWNFSNDDGDIKENGKNAIGLISKTTILHMHHAFLYISLPSLHDYDVKMPISHFMVNINKE